MTKEEIYNNITPSLNDLGENRLLIAGSRNINNIDISKHIPDNIDLIISGGAKGIDSIAEQYADKHKISKIIIRPNYSLYKKAAPLIRNKIMVNISNEIIVFWNGESKGTEFTINYAKKLNKPLKIVIIK